MIIFRNKILIKLTLILVMKLNLMGKSFVSVVFKLSEPKKKLKKLNKTTKISSKIF